MDRGIVGTAAAGIMNLTVASVNQRLFLVSGAEAINPQQYQEARNNILLLLKRTALTRAYPTRFVASLLTPRANWKGRPMNL